MSIPAEYRTCKLCEDEMHFVLHCHALSSEHHFLVIHMMALIPTCESLTWLDQLCCIMSEANKNRKISKYLYSMFMKRVSINCIDILLYFTLLYLLLKWLLDRQPNAILVGALYMCCV